MRPGNGTETKLSAQVSLPCSYHFNKSSLTAYVTVTKCYLEYISENALAGPQ